MIEWIVATFLVVGFFALIRAFGLIDKSREVIPIARRSLEVIRSTTLDDDAKESAVQADAKRLFGLSFVLAVGGAAALLLPVGVLWIGDRLDLVSLQSVMDVAVSPAFLIASSAFAILALSLVSNSPKNGDKKSDYSPIDRLVHRIAFKTYVAQIPLADIESQLFARQLAACKIDRPVFITALPRAGTTLLLECCAQMPDLASHSYRDMPFVLTPCLWNQFSAVFRRESALRERAHGDGMLMNVDSPEALEEVLWKTFWRSHYRDDRIVVWQNEAHEEFEEFFRDHMRKIVLLRRGRDVATARYVSKNNPNTARIGWLHRHFPTSEILVPFREPLQHAASLLKQHLNFLSIQKDDPFASEYMRAIGHFDFGENLRPIDFDGWLDGRTSKDAGKLAFWLEYWVAGYRHLLANSVGNLHFLHYDGLCEDPEHGLQALADVIGAQHPDRLLSAATTIQPVRLREVDTGIVPQSLLDEANNLYRGAKQVALN